MNGTIQSEHPRMLLDEMAATGGRRGFLKCALAAGAFPHLAFAAPEGGADLRIGILADLLTMLRRRDKAKADGLVRRIARGSHDYTPSCKLYREVRRDILQALEI